MWASVLINAGILGAIFLYNYFFAPKPERPENARKQTPQFPRAVEGTPIPLIFGTVKITGPNVIWTAARRISPVSGTLDDPTTIDPTDTYSHIYAYVYELSMAMVCGIPIYSETEPAVCKRVWIADQLATTYIPDGSAKPISITLGPSSTPYDNVAQGLAWWMSGSLDQEYPQDVRDIYDIEHHISLLPDNRGQCILVLTGAGSPGFFWGENPNLPSVAVEIRASGATSDLGSWIAQIGDGDCNPAVVIYRLLTQRWGGIGRYSESQIDLESFRLAAVQLVIEQHGYSNVIYDEPQARQAISDILAQIDALIYEDHATGKLVLKLIRDDYDTTESIVLDKSNIIQTSSFTQSTWSELINRVTVQFTDRDHDYKVRPVTVSNEAGIEAADGIIRSMSYDYLTICNKITAQRVAARQLNVLSQPMCRVRLIVNRDCWNTKPGDVVIWNPEEFPITNMILRVAKVTTGLLTDNRIVLDCFQDRFAANHRLVELPTATTLPILAPGPLTDRLVTEAPRWMLRQIAFVGGPPDADIQRGYYLAGQVDGGTMYRARIEADDSGIRSTDTRDLTFPYASTVAVAFPRTTDAYSTGTYLVLAWDADLYAQLQEATAAQIRAEGRNLILVGDVEFMAFEIFTGVEGLYIFLGNVWRGLLDTPAVDHAVGARVRLLSPPWLAAVGGFGMVLDEVVDVKLIPRSTLLLLPDDQQDSDTLTVRMRTLLPYPPANLLIEGTKTPAELENDDIDLTWAMRERTVDTIVRGDAVDDSINDTTYDVVGRKLGDTEWTELYIGIATNTKISAHAAQVGHGSLEIGVRGRRPDPNGGTDLFSWDVAALDVVAASWRNLLANGDFSDATVTNAWDVATGDAARGGGGSTEALGGVESVTSYYLTTDGASSAVDVSQTVRIDGYPPNRLFAYLDFYDHALTAATGDDTITVTLTSMNADGTTLQSTAYGPTTPSKTSWDRHTLTITNLHPQTDRMMVRIQLATTGANPDAVCTQFRLRIGQVSSDLVTNGNFSGGVLTGWSQDGTWAATSTTKYVDGFYAKADNQAYAELYQEFNVPSGWEYGVAVLDYAVMDTTTNLNTHDSVLAAYDGIGGNSLGSTVLASEVISVKNNWVRRRLYLQLPNGTVSLRIGFRGYRVGAVLGTSVDDISVRIFKDLGPTAMEIIHEMDTPTIQYLPQTVREWERRFPNIPAPDYGFWAGGVQGILGTEPEMTGEDLENGLPSTVVSEAAFTGGPWDDSDGLVTDCLQFDQSSTNTYLRTFSQTYANFDVDEDWSILVVFKTDLASDCELIGRCDMSGAFADGWRIGIKDTGVVTVTIGDGTSEVVCEGTTPVTDTNPTCVLITYEHTTGTLSLRTPMDLSEYAGVAFDTIAPDGLTFKIGRASTSFGTNGHRGQIARVYMWEQALSAYLFDEFWVRDVADSAVFSNYYRDSLVGVVVGSDADGVVVSRYPAQAPLWVYRDELATGDETGWGLVHPREFTNYVQGSGFTADVGASVVAGTSSSERIRGASSTVTGDRARGMYVNNVAIGIPAGSVFVKFMARAENDTTTTGVLVLEDSTGLAVSIPYEFTLTELWTEYSIEFTSWTGDVNGGRLHFYPHTEIANYDPDPFAPGNTPDDQPFSMSVDSRVLSVTKTRFYNVYGLESLNGYTVGLTVAEFVTSAFERQFNSEGEIIVDGLCDDTLPEDGVILNLYNASADKDTRTLQVVAGNPSFLHYDSTATAVESTGQLRTWDDPWIIRCRWSRSGLLEGAAKYAGIMDGDHTWADFYPPPASEDDPPFGPLPAYGRTATWTADQYIISTATVSPAGDWQGILRRVTFTAREEQFED